MSTRATIAYYDVDNNYYKSIYCHWDGYVKGGVGEALVRYYSEESALSDLIELGDISILGNCINDTKAYHRDMKEPKNITIVIDYDDINKQDFNYLFINGEWYYTKYNDYRSDYGQSHCITAKVTDCLYK